MVCPPTIGWSKVRGIHFNPGVCPVMRFAFLIPAIAALGLAACQMPPAVTTGPDVAPVAAPVTTPAPLANIAPETVIATSTDIEIDADAANPDTGNSNADNPDTGTADAVETPVAATQPSRPEPASTDAEPETSSSLTPDDGQPAIETADAPPTITVTPPAAPATTPATIPATANDEAAVPPDGAVPEPPVRTLAEALDEALAEHGVEPETDIVEEAVPATTELARAAPPPPPPELAPEALVGLDARGLRQRLGDADFKRREGPVETWQYRFRTCVVDYFVYAEDADPAVRKWVWRSPVIGGGLDVVACRRALAERDRTNPGQTNPDSNR